MHGVVPAAGRGTRLGPLTDERPKGLVEVADRPLLAHVFEALSTVPVDEITVVVGYQKAAIIDRFGADFEGIPIRYVHQEEPLGIAHALRQAAPHVDEPFVLVNGDNVIREDIERVVEPLSGGADGAILVDRVSPAEAIETGVVETAGRRVVRVVEKPDRPLTPTVTTGLYVLPPAIFAACRLIKPSERGEFELADALDLLCHAGFEIVAVPLEGWRINVNEPVDIDAAERLLDG